ncbi:MAG TPA: (Fe-S)-binding protein [Polyangiaceae bacterium]|nr:(Fe-S)-binding protein [Polyangiaceae bacterium]
MTTFDMACRREPAASRHVKLMVTCLCDLFFDDAAAATVEVLEHLGCKVEVPEDQTCCGQPAFNAGDWSAARRVARHTARVFAGDEPVVVPSGSCARMVSHGTLVLFEGEADPREASVAPRAWELCDFIVNGLGVTRWPGRVRARLAWHRSCHSRGTTYGEAALTLLRSIADLRLVEFGEPEQCCGFGGTFSVSFPEISRSVGGLKLDAVMATSPDGVVSGDMGCLMHLDGLARMRGDRALPVLHVAQVLRDALRATKDEG